MSSSLSQTTTPSLQRPPGALKSRLATIGVVVALITVTAVHIFMASKSSIPVLWTDELGYLSNAQILSGVGEPRQLAGRGYYVGWSLLLTPLWWITSNLELIYRAAVALSVVFGIALVYPLALIARRFGLGWKWALVIGSVVSLAPSHSAMSSFALSENFLTFVVAYTVVAGLRYMNDKTILNAALLGLAAAGTSVIHARTVPIVIAVGLWFLWEIRRTWKASIVGGAILAVVTIGGFLLYRHTISFMYPASADREATGLDRIINGNVPAIITSGTGQIWYEFVVWGGLSVLGGLVLVKGVIREVKARRPAIAVWSAVSLLGIFVISASWVSRVIGAGRDRLDIYSYGRYLEVFGIILATLGLIAIVKGISRRMAIISGIFAVLITAIFFLFIAPQAPLDGILFWGATSVPGLLQWPWPNVSSQVTPPWILAGVAAMLAVVGTLVFRRKPLVIVLIAALFFTGSSVVAEVRSLTPYFAGFYQSFGLRTELAKYPDATVAFDRFGINLPGQPRDAVSRNAYQYWTAPRPSPVIDTETDTPTTDLLIGRKVWPEAAKFGALKIADDTGLFDNALYVLPGKLQDELLRTGVVRE